MRRASGRKRRGEGRGKKGEKGRSDGRVAERPGAGGQERRRHDGSSGLTAALLYLLRLLLPLLRERERGWSPRRDTGEAREGESAHAMLGGGERDERDERDDKKRSTFVARLRGISIKKSSNWEERALPPVSSPDRCDLRTCHPSIYPPSSLFSFAGSLLKSCGEVCRHGKGATTT